MKLLTMVSEKKNFEKEKMKTPKEAPGRLARLMFLWTFPYFYNGNRRDLEEEDLVPTTSKYYSRTVGDELER